MKRRSASASFAILLLAAALLAQSQPNPRAGFYQWAGVFRPGPDLLTAARARIAETPAGLLRFYLGARYDYRAPVLSPDRFSDLAQPIPARIAGLPHYRAAIEDPRLPTVILTVYPALDYGGGHDDIRLTRPWSAREAEAESSQIRALVEHLYSEYGPRDKTIILANTESDDRLLDLMNYTGSPDLAIANLIAWQNTRHDAIAQTRSRHPNARLKILSAFEISLVNLKIRRAGSRFFKSPSGEWNALTHLVPHIRFDLISYSAYESTNSPFQTQNIDTAPQSIEERLLRDAALIRQRARKPLMLGEVGFAYDRFDRLSTSGVAPRLDATLAAVKKINPEFVVFWQVFDAPWNGFEPVEWGWLDPRRSTPPALLRFLSAFPSEKHRTSYR